jgi:TolB-like protein
MGVRVPRLVESPGMAAEESPKPTSPAALADGSGREPAPEPRGIAGVDGVAGLLHRVREHKMVQWGLAYIGAAITIAHGEELMGHAFGWRENFELYLMAFLVVGFPVALTLAWYHGHRGLARISGGESMVASVLLVVAALLWLVLVRTQGNGHKEISPQVAAQPPPAHATTAQAQVAEAPAAASPAPPARPAAGSRPRIAVLPFQNLSPDPNNAFFTDGVHEEILTALANHAPGLEVISRTTMDTYKSRPVTVQTLARDLNCNYVLEGSVRREGDDVRLTLLLIDALNDSHVWARDYDRKLVSAMALESEVAAAVAAQLSQRFAGAGEDSSATTDPLAYDLYLKGRTAADNARQASSAQGFLDAGQLFDRALRLAPNFVRAYLQRANLQVERFVFNYASADDTLPEAHRDLATAQHLAPADPAVIATAAVVAYAEKDYERSLALFESAEAGGLADPALLDWQDALLFAMGRYEQAVALSRRLAELDPKNERAQWRSWYMQMELHQYADALRVTELGIQRGQEADKWRGLHAAVLFYAAGDLAPRRAFFGKAFAVPWKSPQDVQDNVEDAYEELPLEHRYADLRKLVDSSPTEDWNCTYVEWPVYRVGRTPIADIRGWTDLYLNDRKEARRDGQRVLDYLKRNSETQWNRWYRLLLRADAQLFMGDANGANTTAAQSVALTHATPDISDQMNAYVRSVQIMAWSSSKEDAVRRLDELAIAIPGLWPGEIAGNPVYSIPLTPLTSYQALTERLTAQMRASGLK